MALRVGVMLAAVLLLSQVLAMEPPRKRRKLQPEMSLVDFLPEVFVEVVNRLDDPKSLVHFAATCKKAHSVAKAKLLVHRLFYSTINEISDLIQEFCQNVKESPDMRQIVASLPPQQFVRLFDRLTHVTEYSELCKDDEDRYTMIEVSNPIAVFEEEEVIEMVTSLIKAVNRPEITVMASVFLSPDRCLTELVLGFPMPTNIPASFMEYIKKNQTEDLSLYANPERISSIRNLFPPGSRIFPENEPVAYNLVESRNLTDALSADPVSILLALLSVGIRFDCLEFLTAVPVPVESLPAIFPLLDAKSFGFHMVLSYWKTDKKEHALTLLRTPDLRELVVYYPGLVASQLGKMIEGEHIDLIQILVNENFLTEIVNLPIDDIRLLLPFSAALQDVKTVEIAKMFLTVPGIDLYQVPIPIQAPPGPIYSPIQLLFHGDIPDEVAYRILNSSEFQNLIRCNPADFRDFLQEHEYRLQYLQWLCPDFASEIMKDKTLSEQDIQCGEFLDLLRSAAPSA